jgi:serine protease Do
MNLKPIPAIVVALTLITNLHPAGELAAQDRLSALQALSDSFEELADRVNPAVVEIFTTGFVPASGLVSSKKLFAKQARSGSGVIVDSDAYIITNAHVVIGASKVQVRLASPQGPDGDHQSILKPQGELLGAQIVGLDRETDLAVLRTLKKGLPFLPLGDSDDVNQGQMVFAFGSPRGLENSVTIGVVSATARQLREEDPMIYIQTDAPINPGNSGGPLVNTRGEVIGINTMIVSESGGSEGLGFAAPSNIVRYVYEQIRKTGRVQRGTIGARAQSITPLLAGGLGLSRNWGVLLSDVYPGGAAADAGLRVGDMVLTLDGKVMENGRQFRVNLYRHSIGETVDIEVKRGSQKLTFRVPVSDDMNDPDRFAGMVRPEDNLIEPLGILAIELDMRVKILLPGLRTREGAVVAARSLESPMIESLGLLPGDVIFALNRTPVTSLSDLRAAAGQLLPGDTVVFHIERQRQLMYVALRIE